MLQSLDNQAGATQGQALLVKSAWQQSLLAYSLLGVGLAILIFNGLRRLINRFSADPLEMEFT